MGIITERIEGKTIYVEIKSTNLRSALYNTENGDLKVTFNNGAIYLYENVPWELFVKFRMSESQGSFLNSTIKKNYTYKKL